MCGYVCTGCGMCGKEIERKKELYLVCPQCGCRNSFSNCNCSNCGELLPSSPMLIAAPGESYLIEKA